MSLHHLAGTRSRRTQDYLLQTPDTFVWAPLPGMSGATACVHAAPALGAAFSQYTASFEPGGTLGPTSCSRFVYVTAGSLHVRAGEQTAVLGIGGFCYLPATIAHTVHAEHAAATAVVIDKPYQHLEGTPPPAALFGSEPSLQPTPLMGDDALQVRTLLPPDTGFDFAVNTMEYQPGASLSMVEVHVMEHGLLMLAGEGIYRLGNDWHPVTKGDFIWMAPFCPQWFAAIGKQPAKYLIYKDWNRHPGDQRP